MRPETKNRVRIWSLMLLVPVSAVLWLAAGWVLFQLIKAVVVVVW